MRFIPTSFSLPVKNSGIIYITPNNEILLLKMTYGHKKWGTPGGGIDYGETPYEAAVREAKEELSINLLRGSYSWKYSFIWENTQIFVVIGPYLKNIKLSDEHSSYAYVNIDGLKDMDLAHYVKKSIRLFLSLGTSFY